VELGRNLIRKFKGAGEPDVDPRRRQPLPAVDPLRLASQQAADADAIAAEIEQRTAFQLRAPTHVFRIVERESECRADLPELPDRTRADQRFELLRLRMVPVHESLHQQTPFAIGRVESVLDRLGVAPERLLAEDVLAGLERPDRPGQVQSVGE
jgi:hypothetical protein